jgi:hypothetical protein
MVCYGFIAMVTENITFDVKIFIITTSIVFVYEFIMNIFAMLVPKKPKVRPFFNKDTSWVDAVVKE